MIGTDTTGTVAMGNAQRGVNVIGFDHVIGGTTPAERNIISNNGAGGISLLGAGHLVLGNYIGTDVTGSVSMGNGGVGVNTGGNSVNIAIGGTDHDLGVCNRACDLIAASGDQGVLLRGNDNRLEGNFIGSDVTGTTSFGNSSGVFIGGFSSVNPTGNFVGGTAPGAGNLISGNNSPDPSGFAVGGVRVSAAGGFGGHLVQGNLIGTQPDGVTPLPNSGSGVRIDSNDNTIGGTAPGRPISSPITPATVSPFPTTSLAL